MDSRLHGNDEIKSPVRAKCYSTGQSAKARRPVSRHYQLIKPCKGGTKTAKDYQWGG
ncbi:MAG: hypothetical protein ACR2P4_06395 [Gammaproteobacteria bacterium]